MLVALLFDEKGVPTLSNEQLAQHYRWSLPHRVPWAARESGVSLAGVFFVVLALVLAYWFVIAY